jgi:hypothetical protein
MKHHYAQLNFFEKHFYTNVFKKDNILFFFLEKSMHKIRYFYYALVLIAILIGSQLLGEFLTDSKTTQTFITLTLTLLIGYKLLGYEVYLKDPTKYNFEEINKTYTPSLSFLDKLSQKKLYFRILIYLCTLLIYIVINYYYLAFVYLYEYMETNNPEQAMLLFSQTFIFSLVGLAFLFFIIFLVEKK